MIKAFRIDERLIHGQVIATWLKVLGVTHLIVADDDAAKDEVRQKTLKMVLPPGLKCLIKSVDDAVRILKDSRCENMKIFLITGSPQNACKLIREGIDIPEINLANYGGITKSDIKNKVSVSPMVYLDKEDVEATNKLIESGKIVFTQKTPGEAKKIIGKII